MKEFDEIYDEICGSSLISADNKFGRHSLDNVITLAALMDIDAIFDRLEEANVIIYVMPFRSDQVHLDYFEKQKTYRFVSNRLLCNN